MSEIKIPVGQKDLKKLFFDLKNTNRFLNTYIFEGDKGIGKRTMARYFSMFAMCDKNPPCLNCSACFTINASTNPDIVIVSNEDKAEISVMKIRDMVREVFIKPSVSPKKIFIIENAHLMNDAAQNALLKVIEEPPEYAMFLLLCDNKNKILPTILSRCTVISVPPLKKENLFEIFNIENEIFASYSMGNPGRYKNLCEDESFLSLREEFYNNVLCLVKNDRYSIYEICDFFEKNKDYKDVLFEMLMTFFSDVLLLKSSLNNKIINLDKIDVVTSFSGKSTKKSIVNSIDLSSKIYKEIGKYGAFALSVNAMFIKIWEEING
ncbi:MAG: hypothetical protein E7404_04430 [Ruminococcaceae bacterium]|nr:hypothetical protein [Oscillospiraceae bacterium]